MQPTVTTEINPDGSTSTITTEPDGAQTVTTVPAPAANSTSGQSAIGQSADATSNLLASLNTLLNQVAS
jgi:hypothetical protein